MIDPARQSFIFRSRLLVAVWLEDGLRAQLDAIASYMTAASWEKSVSGSVTGLRGSRFDRGRLPVLLRLPDSNDPQPHETDGTEDKKLESVPDSQGNKKIEPAGSAMLEPCGQKCGGQHVGRAEEHERDAPFQAAAGAEPAQEQVGGCVLEKFVEPDGGMHEDVEKHDGVLTVVVVGR